jgi:hypothetical protein
MAISFQIGLPFMNSKIEASTLQITPRISELPIKMSVLYRHLFCPKLKDEERLSRKPNGKEPESAQSLLLDVKDVSSWKGPELERVSKVRLVERFKVNFGIRSGLANAIFFINRLAPHKTSLKLSKKSKDFSIII